ncbi:MAG: alanyl-tRNA editing protein [Deltaproteobacteria bacterium]|nr:alanyl-tRNA editing protein [Deltaproteobacteria bacterium]
MPVEKIFWKDPYLTKLNAKVTSIDGNVITLDKSIFFAVSGGQDSDSGTIGAHRVIDARKVSLEILYTIEGPHTLQRGDEVLIEIDWEKRYRLMRLHFAAEIVLELMYRNYQHPVKIGANISVDKARIDFIWQGNISETFPLIEKKASLLIDSNLPIISEFSDSIREERYWEIEGFAKVACGGTHIRHTGEINTIRLKRNNIGKGKERIEIYLDPD